MRVFITWDEPERGTNLAKHRLDFGDFETGFDFAGALVRPAGGGRSKVIGVLNGEIVAAAIVARWGPRLWR